MVWKNHSVNLRSCWAAVADSSCNRWFSSLNWATSSANSDFWRDSVFNLYSRDSSRSSNWLSLSSAGIASLVWLKKGTHAKFQIAVLLGWKLWINYLLFWTLSGFLDSAAPFSRSTIEVSSSVLMALVAVLTRLFQSIEWLSGNGRVEEPFLAGFLLLGEVGEVVNLKWTQCMKTWQI